MAEYRYTALDEQGREISGALQAETRTIALARLKGMGMFPVAVEAGGGAAAIAQAAPMAASPRGAAVSIFARRVSGSDLALFTRQLASLFNAGLNIGRSLETLSEHTE